MFGNKSAEKDIREYLSKNGYFGNSARFSELEIHAIGRPGWLQVFRFGVEAKSLDDRWVSLFGAMKDDERFQANEIKVYENCNRRNHQLSVWSEGLMKPKYESDSEVVSLTKYISEFAVLMFIIAAIFGLLALVGVK